jgi:hypothetical protein
MMDTLRPLLVISLSFIFSCVLPAYTRSAQKKVEAQPKATTSILLRWKGDPSVERYRLQVARDDKFQDIVFDSAVMGREFRVTNLAPGTYFWRVAPAPRETGAYSQASAVTVAPQISANASVSNIIVPSNSAGWRTATGEVARPVSAQLRAGKGTDLIGTNKDGTTYALDGSTGAKRLLQVAQFHLRL